MERSIPFLRLVPTINAASSPAAHSIIGGAAEPSTDDSLRPGACLARVRQLERAGIIQGYHARLDPFRVGIGRVLFLQISLEGNGPDELARFEAAIAARPQVVEASHVSGEADYLLKVVVQNMPELTRLKDSSLVRYG